MGQEQAKTTQSEPSTFSEPRMKIPKEGGLSPTCFNRFLLHENRHLKHLNNQLSGAKNENHQFAEPTSYITEWPIDDPNLKVTTGVCKSLYDKSCAATQVEPHEIKGMFCNCGVMFRGDLVDKPEFEPKTQQDCDQHFDKACIFDKKGNACQCPPDAKYKKGKAE